MIVYLDTSVALRHLFGQPGRIAGWGEWDAAYSSSLLRVESFRAIDRLRLEGSLPDAQLADAVESVGALLKAVGTVPISAAVLRAAAQPFPTFVRTLDAIHLATALLLKERRGLELDFMTHDQRLGIAARATGLRVFGLDNPDA